MRSFHALNGAQVQSTITVDGGVPLRANSCEGPLICTSVKVLRYACTLRREIIKLFDGSVLILRLQVESLDFL